MSSDIINITVEEESQPIFSFPKVLDRLKTMKRKVSPLLVKLASETSFTPYLHQIVPLFTDDNLLIATKTGSGKTAAALLKFLSFEDQYNSFFVYPTNALIEDQNRSISKLLEIFKIKSFVLTPNTYQDVPEDVEVVLIPLTGQTLDEWQIKLKKKTKGSALQFIFELVNGLKRNVKRCYLTNPDILFLILLLRYFFETSRLKGFHYARTISYIVIDEFHLYTGTTLTKLIASLIFEREYIGGFKSILVLSATPDPGTMDVLSKIFSIKHLNINSPDSYMKYIGGDLEGLKPYKNSSRIVVHNVNVHMQKRSENLIADLEKLLEQFVDEKKRVTTIILNSVLEAKYIESIIKELQKEDSIFSKFEIISYRGLMSKKDRSLELLKHIEKEDKFVLVLGTSAIEVGVDFDTDALIMECSEADSVVQRFGRAGRHKDSEVYMLLQRMKFNDLNKRLSNRNKINRTEFITILNDIFDAPKKYSWLLKTAFGATFIDIFFEREKAILSDLELKELINQHQNKIISNYIKLFNIDQDKYEKIKSYDWYNEYMNFVSLRGGMPSIWVLDPFEYKKFKRNPFYSIDVGFLITHTNREYKPNIVRHYYNKVKDKISVELKNQIKKAPDSIPIISFATKKNIALTCNKEWNKYFYNYIFINSKKYDMTLEFFDPAENDPILLQELEGHIFLVLETQDYMVTDWRIQKIRFRQNPNYYGYIVFDDDAILYYAYLENKELIEKGII